MPDVQLDPVEARVIGALIEKEITTPDHYPLSLNALLNACNQKSNRDPVMDLSEAEVQETVNALMTRHLISERGGFGSRVAKYKHRLCNTDFGTLYFSPAELAVICMLLLRGAQTPGELRAHSGRLHRFTDLAEVEETLASLRRREDGPFVAPLPREGGRREVRWMHLFSGEPQPAEAGTSATPPVPAAGDDLSGRLQRLEGQMAELLARIEVLETRVDGGG